MKPIGACVLFSSILIGMASCKPDKPVGPIGATTPVDGRQKFVGVYDVYDTLSNWQYEMEISLHPGTSIDSLFFRGWGGEFDVYAQHHRNNQSNFVNFGGGFGITDYSGNRWALFRDYDSLFMYNQLVNDTFRMSYLKDNIAFYVDDGVPYFRQSYREFAVKREPE